jgi:hypothetical protein
VLKYVLHARICVHVWPPYMCPYMCPCMGASRLCHGLPVRDAEPAHLRPHSWRSVGPRVLPIGPRHFCVGAHQGTRIITTHNTALSLMITTHFTWAVLVSVLTKVTHTNSLQHLQNRKCDAHAVLVVFVYTWTSFVCTWTSFVYTWTADTFICIHVHICTLLCVCVHGHRIHPHPHTQTHTHTHTHTHTAHRTHLFLKAVCVVLWVGVGGWVGVSVVGVGDWVGVSQAPNQKAQQLRDN